MHDPRVVSRNEWRAARRELLAQEKEFTRQRDALNTGRRNLPMVEIDKEYIFRGPDGQASLPDLFKGRGQLLVYHFMFDRTGTRAANPARSWPTASVTSPTCTPGTPRWP
jgi:predicted dithiol-disulfide oxidoreductase (DUF899 family)